MKIDGKKKNTAEGRLPNRKKDCPSSVSTASTEPKVTSAEFVYLKD